MSDIDNKITDSTADSELITREDGTQVIKVRKRKRRSKQAPKKSQAKISPAIKWANITLLITFIVLPVIGALVIIGKYNGGKFKALTETNIKNISGAENVTINYLKVTPISAKANGINLSWNDDQFTKKANFRKLNAKINLSSFIGQNWAGEEIVADSGSLILRTPINRTDSNSNPSVEAVTIYDFDTLRCEKTTLLFGEEKNAPAIKNIEASLRVLGKNSYKIFFQRGETAIKTWPTIKINSGVITATADKAGIKSVIESPKNTGKIKIEGELSRDIKTPTTANIQVEDFPIEELLGEDLGKLISGNITSENGSLIYNYEKAPEEALNINIPFKSSKLVMEGLPLFGFLNTYTSNARYSRPEFNYCEGTFIRTLYEIKFENIKFISNNLITIRGNIDVDKDSNITGELKVSFPQFIIKEPIPSAFTGPVDGLYECSITLGGNIYSPHDTLTELMTSRSSSQLAPPAQKPSPAEEFDLLTR